MNNDDSRGNQSSYQYRKPSPHKNSYSPNSVYYGNSNHNNQQQQQQQQKKKHFPVHNKGNNNNDRLYKQNDTIIRLLKEIRDRLPAPAGGVNNENGDDFNMRNNSQEEKNPQLQESDAIEMENDDNEETFDNAEEDSFEVENEQD